VALLCSTDFAHLARQPVTREDRDYSCEIADESDLRDLDEHLRPLREQVVA